MCKKKYNLIPAWILILLPWYVSGNCKKCKKRNRNRIASNEKQIILRELRKVPMKMKTALVLKRCTCKNSTNLVLFDILVYSFVDSYSTYIKENHTRHNLSKWINRACMVSFIWLIIVFLFQALEIGCVFSICFLMDIWFK